MKPFIFLAVGLGLVSFRLGGAESSAPSNTVNRAIEKLLGAPNYSWVSTPQSAPGSANWREGPTEGKTGKEETYLHLTVGDADVQVAFRGKKSAINRAGDWEAEEELTGDDEWIARRLRAFKAPALQAQDLLAQAKIMEASDGTFKGPLREEAVRELMTVGRRNISVKVEIEEPRGSVKFWLKEGRLDKFEFNVQGRIKTSDQTYLINRTTTVEIKDVGSTRVALPDAAQKKL